MIFGDERNVDILGAFLLTILDIPSEDVEQIVILNPYVGLDVPEEKKSIMDIKLELKSQRRINVELQVRDIPDIIPRLHYYKAKMVTEQIGSGDLYTALVPTSCVAILDYTMYDNDYCHHAFRYYDRKRDVEFSAYEEIHILEIPKLERDNSNPALCDWLRFLNAAKKEEFDMLAETNVAMKKAVGILADLSADDKKRMIAEAREKELRDQISREQGAKRKALAEGLAKGRTERDTEIVRNMLKLGFSLKDVTRVTGLSEAEIAGLKS
jgi:predicted transposase/invertase (TIGR01784 family)